MKKLLGLLAVAPLSLAACGDVKEIVFPDGTGEVETTVKNEVRYIAAVDTTDAKMIVTGIELSSEDDAAGYNALGLAINTAYAANTDLGKAVDVVLEGELNGVWFHKEFSVTGVKDENDGTPFNNLSDAMAHSWTFEAPYNEAGAAAKALKSAGTHKVPDAITRDEYHEMLTALKGIVSLETSMTYTELSDAQTGNQGNALVSHDRAETTTMFGIDDTNIDKAFGVFTDSYFVFENFTYDINLSSTEITMHLHHESAPANQYYATVDLISTATA